MLGNLKTQRSRKNKVMLVHFVSPTLQRLIKPDIYKHLKVLEGPF